MLMDKVDCVQKCNCQEELKAYLKNGVVKQNQLLYHWQKHTEIQKLIPFHNTLDYSMTFRYFAFLSISIIIKESLDPRAVRSLQKLCHIPECLL